MEKIKNNIMSEQKIYPPIARKIPKELTVHQHTRIDNYFWMNDRENTEVITHLKAENAYTTEQMKHTEDFQKELYDEMIARIKKTDESVPYKKNGYYYYTRTEGDAEYAIYCRKKGNLNAPEEILLNIPEMAKEHAYYSIGGIDVSLDNKLLAYSVDNVSRRKYTIYIKNLETNEVYTDEIKNTSGSITWANDNKTLFYTRKHEETLLPYQVFRHTLGNNVSNDILVYEEKDNTFYTACYKTKSQQYIIIANSASITSEARYIPADTPDAKPIMIAKRERGIEYSVAHYQNHFYIYTNWNAQNFCLMKTPTNTTEKANWDMVIAPRKEVMLTDFAIFKEYLVTTERKNALTHIRIQRWDNTADYYIPFKEDVYDTGLSINVDFDSEELRYGYTSLTTPSSAIDFNMRTHKETLLKEQEVLGTFNKEDYESKRIWVNAKDGTKVPLSLVYKKTTKLDGTAPLWITGYGSYGHSYDVYFSSVRLSLLDRGFVYAIAHIRGGEELGREWYDNGKLLNKKNTFTDFTDCTKYLIDNKLIAKNKVFANGGSAGGLLMGAVANMCPQLYTGIIAQVPFVDVVTTMLDETIPLTTGEFDEWGNPKDKTYYDYILSYSPYDQVVAQDYPAMLITTGLHDSQVQYWEPAKWVAKLRELKTDNNPLYFKIEMDFGHGGASGRFAKLKEVALEYVFVFDLLGIKS